MVKKRPRLMIFVEWDDSAASSRWEDRKEVMERRSLRCETIGLLLSKDEQDMVIAGSYCCDTDTAANVTVIPRDVIRRVVRLGRIRDKKKRK